MVSDIEPPETMQVAVHPSSRQLSTAGTIRQDGSSPPSSPHPPPSPLSTPPPPPLPPSAPPFPRNNTPTSSHQPPRFLATAAIFLRKINGLRSSNLEIEIGISRGGQQRPGDNSSRQFVVQPEDEA